MTFSHPLDSASLKLSPRSSNTSLLHGFDIISSMKSKRLPYDLKATE